LHCGTVNPRLASLEIQSILGMVYVLTQGKINNIFICMQEWTAPEVMSIGAGVDSFFEYALKWYILSGAFVLLILSILSIFRR